MTRYIVFLRAINVGGGRTIKMSVLRGLFEPLEFSGVETFIASGNVVLTTTKQSAKTLERKIEKGLNEALGYEVAAFVRSEAQVAKIANYKPFRQAKLSAAAELNIIFLKDPLVKKFKQEVMALIRNRDKFRVHGREIYWLRHKKQGKSGFANVPLDKALHQPFTIRSAQTVKRLAMKYLSTKS